MSVWLCRIFSFCVDYLETCWQNVWTKSPVLWSIIFKINIMLHKATYYVAFIYYVSTKNVLSRMIPLYHVNNNRFISSFCSLALIMWLFYEESRDFWFTIRQINRKATNPERKHLFWRNLKWFYFIHSLQTSYFITAPTWS